MNPTTLRPADLELHARLGINAALLDAAGVVRVTTPEARERFGITFTAPDLDGLVYPYYHPVTGARVTCRLRRDHPEVDANGKLLNKYLAPFGDSRALFFPPGAAPLLADTSVLALFVEAEKSALAGTAAGTRADRRVLAIGTGGDWSWHGTNGKATAADGARVPVKGPLPDFDRIAWPGRDVVILFDANAATNPKVQAARAALAKELTGRGAHVRIGEVPVEANINGPDDYVAAHGDTALWALIDGARGATHAPGARRARNHSPSHATRLVDLALAGGIELWHTSSGDAFATVRVGTHREHHPLRRVVRDYLARCYFKEAGRAASSSALTDALATLGGMARYDGPMYPTAVRLAEHGESGTVYLDLGDAEWRAIAIDAAGWRVVTDTPVRCWRPASLRPLPLPVPGGTVDLLRDLWSVDDDTWTLVVSWAIAALSPCGPYPALIEVGEQGTGKSMLGRMLRGLIDPASPELRGVPRDEKDVMIGALHSHVVALDNLSGLPVWLSDALCRIATGGGLATRTLYSDLDETSIDVMRPILLTGIEQPATRGDLLDRALVVTLPAITDEARGDEADLWRRYHAVRPAVLGALCKAVSVALRRQNTIRLARRPRMADACRWATAAAPALGWNAGRIVAAWLGARAEASADLLALDPVGQALAALAEPCQIQNHAALACGKWTAELWEGTAADLLRLLTEHVADSVRTARSWPASARGLAGALRRLAPDLRRSGLAVELPKGARTARERIIKIRRTRAEQDTQDRSDTSGDSLNDSADVSCPVAPTGQSTGHQQDAKNTNETGRLSDLSDLSGSLRSPSPEHVAFDL